MPIAHNVNYKMSQYSISKYPAFSQLLEI